jgi:hypothetical protein
MDPVGEHGGGSFTGDSEGKMNFQGMECRRFCRRVSLSVGVPLGNLGRGPFSGNSESRRRAPEMEHLSLQELY